MWLRGGEVGGGGERGFIALRFLVIVASFVLGAVDRSSWRLDEVPLEWHFDHADRAPLLASVSCCCCCVVGLAFFVPYPPRLLDI